MHCVSDVESFLERRNPWAAAFVSATATRGREQGRVERYGGYSGSGREWLVGVDKWCRGRRGARGCITPGMGKEFVNGIALGWINAEKMSY